MGFMDSLLGSPEESSSVSGLGALPKTARKNYVSVLKGMQDFVLPYDHYNGGIKQENIDRFTPLARTEDETRGLDMIRQGFAPTPESLGSDISMLMNPYDDFVIDEINRQAMGQNSILQQNMTNAGQLGSNRQMFGAQEIEDTRLNNIGLFKQDQYNSALDMALGRLTDLRMGDAAGLMGIGEFERGLDWDTKQAPINSLLAAVDMLSGTGTSGAISGSGTRQSTGARKGLLDYTDEIGKVIAGATGFLSDRRLKENIEPAGTENGHNIYRFNYKGGNQKYIGVMADELREKNPEAVSTGSDGYMRVDYARIGVKFREAA